MINKNVTLPKIDEEIFIEDEYRKVVDLLKNISDEPIIKWASPHSEGVCMPSTWQEWVAAYKADKPLSTYRRSDISE
ncbi:hypothetical protein C4588_06550 [Candidatus Parcubacteria bacterium]|nr:MAG: hypothetical protein C4588_06550 [Candidatus Parcubacteria bacterium]